MDNTFSTDAQQQNTAVVPYETGRGIDLNDAAPQRVEYTDYDKRELIERLKERAPQWVPELFPSGRLILQPGFKRTVLSRA